MSSDPAAYRNDYYPPEIEDLLDRTEKKLYRKVLKHEEALHNALWQVDTFTYACQTDHRKMPLSPKLRRLKEAQTRREHADLDRRLREEEARRRAVNAHTDEPESNSR